MAKRKQQLQPFFWRLVQYLTPILKCSSNGRYYSLKWCRAGRCLRIWYIYILDRSISRVLETACMEVLKTRLNKALSNLTRPFGWPSCVLEVGLQASCDPILCDLSSAVFLDRASENQKVTLSPKTSHLTPKMKFEDCYPTTESQTTNAWPRSLTSIRRLSVEIRCVKEGGSSSESLPHFHEKIPKEVCFSRPSEQCLSKPRSFVVSSLPDCREGETFIFVLPNNASLWYLLEKNRLLY